MYILWSKSRELENSTKKKSILTLRTFLVVNLLLASKVLSIPSRTVTQSNANQIESISHKQFALLFSGGVLTADFSSATWWSQYYTLFENENEWKEIGFVMKKLKKIRFCDFQSQKIKILAQSRLIFWKTCQDSKKMTWLPGTWDVYG